MHPVFGNQQSFWGTRHDPVITEKEMFSFPGQMKSFLATGKLFTHLTVVRLPKVWPTNLDS